MSKDRYLKIILLILVLIVVGGVSLFAYQKMQGKKEEPEKTEEPGKISDIEVNKDDSFTVNIIKKSHSDVNYLISPYSIEIALNMLREGASGVTKEEMDKVIGSRNIPNLSIQDKLNIANAIFVKDNYKNVINNSFYNNMKNKYDSEILYDKFTTPDVINNWVKEKTNKMIPKLLDSIDRDFVLGLANAIALDIKWQREFECDRTSSEVFTKKNNTPINVEMMHQNYKNSFYKYLKETDLEGIIIPYEEVENSEVNLEFVAIMPKDINKYITELSDEKLRNIDNTFKVAGEKTEINLSLPRFTYEYDLKTFKAILINLGIKSVFDGGKADLTGIIEGAKQQNNLYVNEAIHKTKIELMEKGTKAAAVTYFGMKDNAIPMEEELERISLKFNKPFIYMIRDQKTKEILFFGTVYEPNLWNGTTCK